MRFSPKYIETHASWPHGQLDACNTRSASKIGVHTMNLASGRQRAMLFVDGGNFLIELLSQLGVEKRAADRSRVHAINLAHQVILASVYQDFLRITEP
jgi:hypothetical protein